MDDAESLKALTARVSAERRNEVCPFCIERLPDFWKRDKECFYYVCCGKLSCKKCNREWQKKAGENANRCPNCRTLIPKNYEEVFERVMPIAVEGKAWAQFKIGSKYHKGIGVSADLIKAAAWYKKAAEQGWHEASCNLGLMCGKGEGVEKDLVEAQRWYEIAAASGDAKPLCNLAVNLMEGNKFNDALLWMVKAAGQGHAVSQYVASKLTRELKGSEGIPRAYYWIQKTLEDLNPPAGAMEMKNNLETTICSRCTRCRKERSSNMSLHRCARCRAVSYCSRECETADWKAGHKKQCVPKDIEDRSAEERLKFFTS